MSVIAEENGTMCKHEQGACNCIYITYLNIHDNIHIADNTNNELPLISDLKCGRAAVEICSSGFRAAFRTLVSYLRATPQAQRCLPP